MNDTFWTCTTSSTSQILYERAPVFVSSLYFPMLYHHVAIKCQYLHQSFISDVLPTYSGDNQRLISVSEDKILVYLQYKKNSESFSAVKFIKSSYPQSSYKQPTVQTASSITETSRTSLARRRPSKTRSEKKSAKSHSLPLFETFHSSKNLKSHLLQ